MGTARRRPPGDGELYMGEQEFKKVWLALAVIALAATYPSWLTAKPHAAGYDAPWVYPALSSAVDH